MAERDDLGLFQGFGNPLVVARFANIGDQFRGYGNGCIRLLDDRQINRRLRRFERYMEVGRLRGIDAGCRGGGNKTDSCGAPE